jgi:hypothetical protein
MMPSTSRTPGRDLAWCFFDTTEQGKKEQQQENNFCGHKYFKGNCRKGVT